MADARETYVITFDISNERGIKAEVNGVINGKEIIGRECSKGVSTLLYADIHRVIKNAIGQFD